MPPQAAVALLFLAVVLGTTSWVINGAAAGLVAIAAVIVGGFIGIGVVTAIRRNSEFYPKIRRVRKR